MPINVLHISDIHLGSSERYGHIDPQSQLNTRFLDLSRAFCFAVDYAIQNEIDLFLFAGDAYKNAYPDPVHQSQFAEQLAKLSKAGIETVLLVGNHDQLMRNNQSHAMSVFDSLNLDKITVIQKPALLKLNTKNGPIQIIGLPYVRPNQLLTIDEYRNLEPAQLDNKIRNNVELVFKNYYNQLEKDTAAIVTAHMTLDQAVAGIEEELMVGHNITFPSSIFEDHRVNYVALGHVHKHQVIRKNNPGIVYSGSPERIDFSEEKEDKGFMHVCINGNDTTFKFISTNARTFITISIDLSNHEHKTENDANESLTLAIKKELAKVKIADCVLRLRCKIKQEDFAKLNVKEIEKLFTDCFYFQFEPQIFTLERKSRIPELESMDGQTPLSALKTYLQEVKPERLEPLLGKAAELMQNINEKDSKK